MGVGGSKLGKKQRLLLKVERLGRNHYKLVFLLALLAVVAAVWLGSRVELETDVLELFPHGNRNVDTFKSALKQFGSLEYLIILVEAGPDEGPDELEEFADLMAERLEQLEDLVELVEYRFKPDSDFLELFYDNALLFLDPHQLPALEEKLSGGAIRRQVRENRASLASPAGDFTEGLIANDPLDLMPLFVNRLLGNRGAFQVDLSDGYYLSRDGQSLLMLVKPLGHPQDLAFDEQLMTAVRDAEAEVREEMELELEDLGEGPLGIRVGYTGNFAAVLDESGLIRQDIKKNLFISLLAVSALYWLCYRRFAALLYATLPLLVGQALTFALAFYALGYLLGGAGSAKLNASSSAFTALLMGLGTDFTIVMYARYVEERQAGRSLVQATEAMVGQTGLGVFTGAITSAGTFYAMCISSFRGLFDLGFLIGTGILLCAVAILFLLPAMITWNESVRPRKVDAVKKLHLQSFGLEHLITFSARHRWLVIGGVVALTIVGGLLALQLDFDDSIRSLRSNRSEAYQVQQEVADRFGASLSYMMAVATADTEAGAITLTEKIERRLQPFLDSGIIGSYDSLLNYVPPEPQQQQIIQALRQGSDGPFDYQRVRGTFEAALVENGFLESAFDQYIQRMERFLSPERPLEVGDLQRQGLGRVVERYLRQETDGFHIVTYLFPTDPRWKRGPPPGLIEELTHEEPGIVVTGTNVVSQELRRIYTRDAPLGVAVGLIIVFVLLILDFRSLRLTAIAMVQLICGVIMMLGMIKLAGIVLPGYAAALGIDRLNFANSFVATMILGVGIDYSIHLVHRMNWSGGRVDPGLLETGKAVVMAALTNIAGFGTLTLGNYPALRSFGLVAMFGSLACLFTALTLVPALMARRPEASG